MYVLLFGNLSLGMYVCVHNNNYDRIYSIKRRGILEIRAGWRGRRLFEGGVYYYVPAIRTRSALKRSRKIDVLININN